MINSTISKILNPELDAGSLLKEIVFLGQNVNSFIVKGLNAIVPLTDTQNQILLAVVYLVIAYIIIEFAENLKKPIKIGIVGLLLFLVIGFFKI